MCTLTVIAWHAARRCLSNRYAGDALPVLRCPAKVMRPCPGSPPHKAHVGARALVNGMPCRYGEDVASVRVRYARRTVSATGAHG